MRNEFGELIKEESRIWTVGLVVFILPCLTIAGIIHFFPNLWGWFALGTLTGAAVHWMLQHIV